MVKAMKNQFKVDELEENIEELKEFTEDVSIVIYLSVVVSLVLLGIFILRLYNRWTVACPDNYRCDDKTIIITGEIGAFLEEFIYYYFKNL